MSHCPREVVPLGLSGGRATRRLGRWRVPANKDLTQCPRGFIHHPFLFGKQNIEDRTIAVNREVRSFLCALHRRLEQAADVLDELIAIRL